MIVEQLIFITAAFALFVYMFYEFIRKNDTKYVPILAIEFIHLYFSKDEISFAVKMIIYLLSIIIPIVVIVLEKIDNNIGEMVDSIIARIYLVLGNTKAAKNKLIKIVEKNPNSYIGHKLLGYIYEKEGGQRKAVDEYAQAIRINPKDYETYYKVANLLTDLDKKDEAINTLTTLLNKNPEYTEATIALGDLLIEKEDYKEAVNIYTEALKYNPTSFDLNYNLGIVYTMLNDFPNAKVCYEKAAELNSLVYNTKYSLAEIALMYKELDEAEQYFLQVTEDEELCADAYLELAKIYIIKNDKDRAIQYANVAIQENPKRIVEKIKNDVTFAIIIAKLSIPFNLEIDEEEVKKQKLTKKEIKAKEHLEEMVEITKKIGYSDVMPQKREFKSYEDDFGKDFRNQKERE